MLELLAPAGDKDSFYAAINNGADAVYLGLETLNARIKAPNFVAEELRPFIEYAHFFGVKVYITINTIVHNHEFEDLFSIVKIAVEAKADAFIVQDLGVAYALKRCFKGITLHASTQLGVHNLYGAMQAERIGFTRVVLSRETKLEDIKLIKDNTALELEFFVHGALCVCFSGNCYLSAAEQDASGNRGLCKQLCRLPYKLQETNEATKNGNSGEFLLSAKDLCLADSLAELAEAGVTSFKIEGRMRRAGYVGKVTEIYRRLLDEIGRKDVAGLTLKDKSELKKVFGRGDYSPRAYLDTPVPDIIEKFYNNHTGVEIGRVTEVKPFKDLFRITVSSKCELHNGDGLKFYENEIEKASLGIGEIRRSSDHAYSFISKARIMSGWKAHLILDSKLETETLRRSRTLPVSVDVIAKVGQPLKLCAVCSGVTVCAQTDAPLEKAVSAPLSESQIIAQLSKFGESGFSPKSVNVRTDGVFAAKSVLNSVRRELLTRLKEKIIACNEKEINVEFDNNRSQMLLEELKSVAIKRFFVKELPFDALHYLYPDNRSSVLRKGELAVISPSDYSFEAIKSILDCNGITQSDAALELPHLVNGRDIEVIESVLEHFDKIKILVSQNIYGFAFAERGYKVICGGGHNVINDFALNGAFSLGASAVIPSFEADAEFSTQYSTRLRLVDYEQPVMILAHCPYKTVYRNGCNNCKYPQKLFYFRGKRVYSIRRIKLFDCSFQLYRQN